MMMLPIGIELVGMPIRGTTRTLGHVRIPGTIGRYADLEQATRRKLNIYEYLT